MAGRLGRVLVAIGLVMAGCCASNPASAAAGSVSLTVTDRLGRSFPVVAVLRGADGKEIARSAAPGEPVRAAPGQWTIFPFSDPERAQPVELGDGASIQVTIHAPDAIWFKLHRGDNRPDYDLLLRQKDRKAVAELLPRLRFVRDRDRPYALPRPDASPEARAAALRVAREELAKPIAASSGASEAGAPPWKAARVWANRILDAIGEASDAHGLPTSARIELRLGLLAKGTVAAAISAGDDTAASAALWLHAAGYDAGDALILDSAAEARRPWVFGALLDFPPEAVRPAMISAAQRYVARAKEIAAGSQDRFNRYEQHIFPVILFLSAYGPDDVLATVLDHFEAYVEDTPILGVLAADPAQFADYLISASGLDDATSFETMDHAADVLQISLARLCGAAETLGRSEAESMWARLYRAMYERVAEKHQTYYAASEVTPDVRYPTFAAEGFLTRAGHCTTNRWVTRQYLEQDSGNWSGWIPYLDWIPRYWQEQQKVDLLIKYTGNIAGTSDFLDQLDLIPHDRLEALFAAKGTQSDTYPIDIYRAYHSVASHANGAFPPFPVRVTSDAEARPYVMGRTGQLGEYDGVVSGIAKLRPELVEGRLRLHLFLEQVTSYAAHFQVFGRDNLFGQYTPADGGQRYIIDHGRALIEAVKLLRGNVAVPVTDKGLDEEGALVFEAEVGDSGIESLIAEIDLGYFDDRRQLVFELFGSDYAVRVRRGASAAARAKAALITAPSQAQTYLELARAEASQGHMSAAVAVYQRVLAAQSSNVDLWMEVANLHAVIEDHPGAGEVLRAGLAANPGNYALLTELANALFLAGQYAEAAVRYADLAKSAPDEPLFSMWQGVTLLLAGDLVEADRVLAGLPPGFQMRLSQMLRLVIAEWGPDAGKEAARKRYAAFADGEKGKPDEGLTAVLIGGVNPDTVLGPTINRPNATASARCDAELWVGERLAFQSNVADARPHLEAALANCKRPQPEYHLARLTLVRLSTP
jgi:tetratricopeptide (TPR) repeat protein